MGGWSRDHARTLASFFVFFLVFLSRFVVELWTGVGEYEDNRCCAEISRACFVAFVWCESVAALHHGENEFGWTRG